MICFVWIPKNAGTSIEQTLTAATAPLVLGVSSLWLLDGPAVSVVNYGHALGPAREPVSRYVYTVRDPFSRAVSLWQAFTSSTGLALSFDGFCEDLHRLNWQVPPYRHNLLCRQWDYVRKLQPEKPATVLRFEQLGHDWRRFTERHLCGRSLELQHQRRTPLTCDWLDHYTGRTEQQVAEHFAEDFVRLGYLPRLPGAGP